MIPKIFVAGVGNVFLADDGFGVEVAKYLAGQPVLEGVTVADFGIRGVNLAYRLLEGYDALILVDAARRGEPPGTVFVVEPDFSDEDRNQRGENGFILDAHRMDPELVLGMLESLGGKVARVLIVGCEPETIEERMVSANRSRAPFRARRAWCSSSWKGKGRARCLHPQPAERQSDAS
jgi:hydrogenase maturation protease